MAAKARNIVIGTNEYETGILHTGTEAERLAYSAKEGDEWNQTGGSSIIKYVYYKNAWHTQVVLGTERVSITFSVSGGSQSLVNSTVKVAVLGYSTNTYMIDSSYLIEFDVPIGATYIITYPEFALYTKIPDTRLTASQTTRSLSQIYTFLSDSVCAITLEKSNPSDWVRSGNTNHVDALLDTTGDYGTYIIDDANRKYAKLDPTDHRYFIDGTAWTGLYGNSFRRLPKVYYRVVADSNGNKYVMVSTQEIADGHYLDEDWIGTYKGCVVNNVLLSRPYLTSTQNTTMSAFWDRAQGNVTTVDGYTSEYGLVNYFDHQKLVMLHLAAYGNSDSTQTMGPGLQDAGSGYYTHTTGSTIALGDTTGQALYSGNYYMNKLFGIEDLAGSTWEFRPNIRFTNNGAMAIVYEGNIVSNEANGRSFTKLASAIGAYVKNMVLGEYFDVIAQTVGGSSATYWCDGTWASTGGELLLVGGCSVDGSLCGLSAATSIHSFSSSYAYFGARLAFKGDITKYELVSGSTLASLHQ